MMDALIAWDEQVFQLLNAWNSWWADPLMYIISTRTFWIPFYLLLAWIIGKKRGWKYLGILLLSIAILILLTDQSTSSFFKPFFGRFRPCRVEAGLAFDVHIVNGHCGGAYGFISSHAANFFGLASFLSFVFTSRNIRFLFFGIAFIVSYSRIYLGVHFPADVIIGGMWGSLLGIFLALSMRYILRKFPQIDPRLPTS